MQADWLDFEAIVIEADGLAFIIQVDDDVLAAEHVLGRSGNDELLTGFVVESMNLGCDEIGYGEVFFLQLAIVIELAELDAS